MKHFKYIFLISGLILTCSIQSQVIVKDTSYTAYQTCIKVKKKYPDIKIVEPVKNAAIIANQDVAYKALAYRQLHLDIYRPAKQGKYPALIMIHGGGWRSGNKGMEKPMAQRIALSGYVAIPVEYRLSLEAIYPAAVHDIKAAIRFIKDNSEKYGIDTTKIAIEGESAGGQLAMLVAMTNNVAMLEGDKTGSKSTSTVHAAIDVDGVVDFLAPNSLNIPQTDDSPGAYWLGGIYAKKPLIWKEASPIYWVNKNTVPVLFITSSVPRYHAGRDEMIDLLNQNNIYYSSCNLPDSPHSFWLFDPWAAPTKKYILKFLNKVF